MAKIVSCQTQRAQAHLVQLAQVEFLDEADQAICREPIKGNVKEFELLLEVQQEVDVAICKVRRDERQVSDWRELELEHGVLVNCQPRVLGFKAL